jgi:hypothetical protein
MLQRINWNGTEDILDVTEDIQECYRGYTGMLQRINWNVTEDIFDGTEDIQVV